MKLNKKVFISLIFVIGLISLLMGSFAYYRIVVNGSITGNTGKAVFVLRDTVDGESWNNKNINLGSINPGDSGSFDVVMDASGSTVDMYATLNIERNNLPSNLKFYTTADHKSELHKYYSFLEKNGTNKEKLTVYWYWNPYVDDSEDSNYMNRNISTTINVNAVQISEYATMKNGSKVTYSQYDEIEELTGTEFWNEVYRPYIRTVNFDNDLSNLPSTCTEENLCWDISESATQKKKVYGYLVDTGLKDDTDNTKTLYNLYIVSEAPIFAPSNCESIFSFYKRDENYKNISNLIQIKFNNNFNTSKVTDMNCMFQNCSSLTSLDLSSFNTINVINMSGMINIGYPGLALTSLNLSNFNTANVTNMKMMFDSCSSITSLDLSSFNTTNVTTMSGMFSGCSSLTSLDLSCFNTAKVTDMTFIFHNCTSLIGLDLSNFNTVNVTDMTGMFGFCSSLISLDLSSFNTAKVSDMGSMFWKCSSIINLNLSSFNTAKVSDMGSMFHDCSSLTSLDLSNFNTSNLKDIAHMFNGCSSLTNLDLSKFNTTNIAQMQSAFEGCSSLTTTINITNLNLGLLNSVRYLWLFKEAATTEDATITIDYMADLSNLVNKIINEKSPNSNIVKGSVIPEHSITISGNDDIKSESNNKLSGTLVSLLSISGNNHVTSFKMNGTLINGYEFIMPNTDVSITDIVTTPCKTIETTHYPYQNNQNYTVLGEYTFDGAKSLTVILEYEAQGTNWDHFFIYDSPSATTGINDNHYYGGDVRTKETITLNSNYIKITFKSHEESYKYFGLRAIVIPNY